MAVNKLHQIAPPPYNYVSLKLEINLEIELQCPP